MTDIINTSDSRSMLMSIAEAAEYTKYTVRYLYKLTSERRIPYYKPMGGRVFFKREDLDAFMMRGRVAADYELEAEAVRYVLNKAATDTRTVNG